MEIDVKKLGNFEQSCNKLFHEIIHTQKDVITPIDLRFYLNRKVLEQFLQSHNRQFETQLDEKQFKEMLKKTQTNFQEENTEIQQAFEALLPKQQTQQKLEEDEEETLSPKNNDNEEMVQAFEALIPEDHIAEELSKNFGIELDLQKLKKDHQLSEMTFLEFKQFLNS